MESCTRWELFPTLCWNGEWRADAILWMHMADNDSPLHTRRYTHTHTHKACKAFKKKWYELNKVGKTNKALPGRWSKQHKSARGNAFSAIVVATECSCMHFRGSCNRPQRIIHLMAHKSHYVEDFQCVSSCKRWWRKDNKWYRRMYVRGCVCVCVRAFCIRIVVSLIVLLFLHCLFDFTFCYCWRAQCGTGLTLDLFIAKNARAA